MGTVYAAAWLRLPSKKKKKTQYSLRDTSERKKGHGSVHESSQVGTLLKKKKKAQKVSHKAEKYLEHIIIAIQKLPNADKGLLYNLGKQYEVYIPCMVGGQRRTAGGNESLHPN